MKATACWLIVALLAGIGCVELPIRGDQAKPPSAVPTAPKKPAVSVAPVTADQVSRENAREKAAALQQELDRETQGEARSPAHS